MCYKIRVFSCTCENKNKRKGVLEYINEKQAYLHVTKNGFRTILSNNLALNAADKG